MFFIYLYKKCLAFTNALAIYLCLLITPTIIVTTSYKNPDVMGIWDAESQNK